MVPTPGITRNDGSRDHQPRTAGAADLSLLCSDFRRAAGAMEKGFSGASDLDARRNALLAAGDLAKTLLALERSVMARPCANIATGSTPNSGGTDGPGASATQGAQKQDGPPPRGRGCPSR